MKTCRRIEITAFRRRVTIVSGEPRAEAGETGVSVSDADSQETIEPASDEGREILLEAIRLLEETVYNQPRMRIKPSHSPTHEDYQLSTK